MDDYSTMKAPETLAKDDKAISNSPIPTIAICAVILGGFFILFLLFYLVSRINFRRRFERLERARQRQSWLEVGEKQVGKDAGMKPGELELWLRRKSFGRFGVTGDSFYTITHPIPFEDWPSISSCTSLMSQLKTLDPPYESYRPVAPAPNTPTSPSMSFDQTGIDYSIQLCDLKPGLPKIFAATQNPCLRSVSNPGPRYRYSTPSRPRCRPRSNSLGSNFLPTQSFIQSFSGAGVHVPAPPSKALICDGTRPGWDTPLWVPAEQFSQR